MVDEYAHTCSSGERPAPATAWRSCGPSLSTARQFKPARAANAHGPRPRSRLSSLLSVLVAIVLAVAACDEDSKDAFTASGVIESETVDIASQTGGIVETVTADVGDTVEAGDLLIELETAVVDAQLDGADASVDASRAALDALTADPRPEELAVARARLGVSVAQWDGARRAWENASAAARLAQSVPAVGAQAGAATLDPRTAMSQAETAYRQSEVTVDAATAAIEALMDGARPDEIAAAEANVRQAEAAREAIAASREKARLRSPISGRVLGRSAQRGELARPGAVLMRVMNPLTTTLTVYVPEDRIGDIQIGQEVEVTVDAYEEETFDGEVTFIADEAEFTPRNVQTEDQRANLVFAVTITVDNADKLLRAGMPADAKILLD